MRDRKNQNSMRKDGIFHRRCDSREMCAVVCVYRNEQRLAPGPNNLPLFLLYYIISDVVAVLFINHACICSLFCFRHQWRSSSRSALEIYVMIKLWCVNFGC